VAHATLATNGRRLARRWPKRQMQHSAAAATRSHRATTQPISGQTDARNGASLFGFEGEHLRDAQSQPASQANRTVFAGVQRKQSASMGISSPASPSTPILKFASKFGGATGQHSVGAAAAR